MIRCPKCERILFNVVKDDGDVDIQIKCARCKTMWRYSKNHIGIDVEV